MTSSLLKDECSTILIIAKDEEKKHYKDDSWMYLECLRGNLLSSPTQVQIPLCVMLSLFVRQLCVIDLVLIPKESSIPW
jgi:hypothetical protein